MVDMGIGVRVVEERSKGVMEWWSIGVPVDSSGDRLSLTGTDWRIFCVGLKGGWGSASEGSHITALQPPDGDPVYGEV